MDHESAASQKAIRGIGQIAGHLIHPWPIRFRYDSSNVDFPSDQPDDEHDMVADKARSGSYFDGEEIRCRDGIPMGC